MKNIKIIIIILVLSISYSTFSQKIYFIEPRFNLESLKPEVSSFDLNGNYYILLESSNLKAPLRVDLQLISYDASGKPLNSFMIEKTMNGAEPNFFEGIFPLGGKLVLFKSGYDTQTKKTNLFYYILDEKGNKSAATQIASVQGTGMFNSGGFELSISPDNNKLLVFTTLPRVKKTNEKIVFTVFDNKLNKLKSKSIELPYIWEKHTNNDAFINNNGNIFLLKKVYAKKKNPDREMVFTFSPELDLVSESPHQIGELGVISSYKHYFNDKGSFVFGGLFYDYKKAGLNVSDPDGPFISVCTVEGKLHSGFSTKSYGSSYITNQIMHDAIGNYFISVEHVLYKSETVGAGTAPVYNDLYTNQDADIIKFNSQNRLEWIYTIERDEQQSTNDNAKGNRVWATVLPSNEVAVFYRDSWARHDGVKRKVITPPVIYWKGNVMEIINQDGSQRLHKLIRDERFGGKSGQYNLFPQTGHLVDGRVLMLSFRHKELVSTVLTVE